MLSTSGAAPSAIGAPSASSTTREANAATNSGSWVATSSAQPSALIAARQLLLDAPVHAAGRLVEAQDRRRLARIPEHDREREPLLLAAGEVARMAERQRLRIEADAGEGLRRCLLGDRLVDQIVGRVLKQQRDPAGRVHTAAGRAHQTRGVSQQRRLAGAVSTHQRHPFAGRRC